MCIRDSVSAVPDNGGEHRNGDVVVGAHANAGHDEIEEHEDAGAALGDAVEVSREHRRRRRTDAHHRRRVANAAQHLSLIHI